MSGSSTSHVAAVEIPDLLPAVVRGLRPVCRPVHREKGVSCAVIGVELVRLAEVIEDLGQLARLARGWVLVVGAEQPEQRTRQVWRQPNDRRNLEWHAFRRWVHDAGTVAVNRRVELKAARR